MAMNYVNRNFSPLYTGTNGINSIFTHRDLLSETPMNGIDATIQIASVIPMAKVSSMAARVERTVINEVASEVTRKALTWPKRF